MTLSCFPFNYRTAGSVLGAGFQAFISDWDKVAATVWLIFISCEYISSKIKDLNIFCSCVKFNILYFMLEKCCWDPMNGNQTHNFSRSLRKRDLKIQSKGKHNQLFQLCLIFKLFKNHTKCGGTTKVTHLPSLFAFGWAVCKKGVEVWKVLGRQRTQNDDKYLT